MRVWGFVPSVEFYNAAHVTVYNWIKSFGEAIDTIRSESPVKVVEIDEMRTFISLKKNYCWIWIAVDRHGKRFINCVLGDRGQRTGQQLWCKLERIDMEHGMADFWKPYKNIVPHDIHTQSKVETFTVKGYNGLFRHFLTRLRRKTKCYSKSKKMLKYSIKLLMLKRNNELKTIPN